MKLAEQMRKISEDAINLEKLGKTENAIIDQISRCAENGRTYTTYNLGNMGGAYVEMLKSRLCDDGFKVEIRHTISPWDEYSLAIYW